MAKDAILTANKKYAELALEDMRLTLQDRRDRFPWQPCGLPLPSQV